MRDFIISLLSCSAIMSILALLYMAFAPMLKKRYSPKGVYYVWLIIVLGLIIPFRPQWDNPLIRLNMPGEETAPITQMSPITPMDNTPAAAPKARPIRMPESAPIQQTAPATPMAPVSRPMLWWEIAMAAWLIGTVAALSYQAVKHDRFVKTARRWSETVADESTLILLNDLKAEMGISGKIGLCLCSAVFSPMMIGFIKPTILLPKTGLDSEDLRFILRHELIHYKRKDLYYKGLVLLANCMHWFNPVTYLMARAISVDCELSCDAELIRNTDLDIRKHYSETIIGVARYQSKQKTVLSTNFYGGKKGMKKRIYSIMDTGKKKAGAIILCAAFIVTLCTGFAFAANTTGFPQTDLPEANPQAASDSGFTYITNVADSLEEAIKPYEHLGVSVDSETALMIYEGCPVREIVDPIIGAIITESVGAGFGGRKIENAVDLTVQYENDEPSGFRVSTQEEYDARTEERVQDVDIAENIQEEFAFTDNRADADTYSIYEPFGLTIDEETGKLLYYGGLVRSFTDRYWTDAFSAHSVDYYEEDGMIDVRAVRDYDDLIGVEIVPTAVSSEQINQNAFAEYEKYGLTYDTANNTLYYNGETVRLFLDIKESNGKEVFTDGFSGSIVFNWNDKVDEGIDVYGVRDQEKLTPEGFGTLTGLRVATEEEYAKNTEEFRVGDTFAIAEPGAVSEENPFAEYEEYGLTYNAEEDTLSYNGQTVRRFLDIRKSNGAEFLSAGFSGSVVFNVNDEGSVDIYGVRDQEKLTPEGFGTLIGLRAATKEEYAENTHGPKFVDDDMSPAFEISAGDPFGEYAPYGLTYDESENALWYQGQRVRRFADIKYYKGQEDPIAELLETSFPDGSYNIDWDTQYFDAYGTTDVYAVRDHNDIGEDGFGKLNGLRAATEEEYAVVTRNFAEITENAGFIGATAVSEENPFAEYEEYGLTYDESENALRYQGGRVRQFLDIRNSNGLDVNDPNFLGNTVSNWDQDGTTDIYAVRDYDDIGEDGFGKLTGLRLATPEEYARISHNLKMESNSQHTYYDYSELFASNEEPSPEYEAFGISYDEDGNMLYDGQLVAFFWDGYWIDGQSYATRYAYQNLEGIKNIHTVRGSIDNGDGSVNPFGELLDIVEFTEADAWQSPYFLFHEEDGYLGVADFSSPATAQSEYGGSIVGGRTIDEYFEDFKEYFIKYSPSRLGLGNIYYKGELVKTFIDEKPDGGVFMISSARFGGEISVKTVYDAQGNLTGVEIVD